AGWLIGEQPGGDPTADRKYYWSNLRPRAALETLVGYAHRRHWVEQFHEEAKGLLGWDQYQGRLWTGFHRNAVAGMLAYSFLVWREWQQRPQRAGPGRPRRAFPPRRDRRRVPLPAIHRQVCDWLRLRGAKEFLRHELMTVQERVPA